MEQIRILAIVRGGVLQEVRANVPATIVNVKYLDWDNVEAGNKWQRMSNERNIERRVREWFPHSIW
jgi:hypothetical protein